MKKNKWFNKDLMAKKEFAEIYEVKDLECANENCIRLYCTQAPDVFNFQIRTFKSITDKWNNSGKRRNMIANVSLTITEVEEILHYMKKQHPKMKPVNTLLLKRF